MYITKYSIREQNTHTLLKYIFENQPISRARLSREIGLSKASVSDIIRNLIEKPNELITEVGSGDSTNAGGRKPIYLAVNPNAGCLIGIDVGINSIRRVTSFFDGSIRSKEKYELHGETEFFDIIKEMIELEIKNNLDTVHGILAVTISVQGAVFENKIMFTPNYNVVDLEALQSEFDFPIYFENEANLAALSENYTTKEEHVAAITLRTGIGAGIIFDNEIFYGHEGGAGEIGHTIVVPYGKICPCGNQGCLEQYASERAIIELLREAKNDPSLSIDDFIKLFNDGDSEAISILETSVKFLGIAINNFLSLYSLPKVYVVGTLPNGIDSLVPMLQSELKGVFSKYSKLSLSSIGKYASAYGASIYGIKQFHNIFAGGINNN